MTDLVKNAIVFMQEMSRVCEEPEKDYVFTCPICGGEAHAIMARINGHHHGYCKGCDMTIME